MRGWLWAAAILVGCNNDRLDTEVIEHRDDEIDRDGPIIEHAPILDPQVYGVDVLLEARVKDVGGKPLTEDPTDEDPGQGSGVAVVEVYYRQETSIEYKSRALVMVGTADDGMTIYQGSIRGQDVGSGGMRYYLQAIDFADNASCLPEDCEDDDWHFAVIPAS